jgi:poly-gamma-glutamate capsule biosynthesis protein CapA/YwtB (metallophosphatase superfamily)
MADPQRLKLFLCGDVMTGRGVDQILRCPCPPRLEEPVATSALDYVEMAERVNGPIPLPVDDAYVWGDALRTLEEAHPDVRIANLETSVTTSENLVPKGINYRMHPDNVPVLTAAGIDCVSLANNHVLDWGEQGLIETLETLEGAGIRTCGAGRDAEAASEPAVLDAGQGRRVIVFGFCTTDSGVPPGWGAASGKPGVNLLPEPSSGAIDAIAGQVNAVKRKGDLAVASIHWGENWGYRIEERHRAFAHRLIDDAAVDVVHGHSSHHPKAIEIHRGRPTFHGCGDFLNDYEGLNRHGEVRGDVVLMYLPTFDLETGTLVECEMVPFGIRRMRLTHTSPGDRAWLRNALNRECGRFGHSVTEQDRHLALLW